MSSKLSAKLLVIEGIEIVRRPQRDLVAICRCQFARRREIGVGRGAPDRSPGVRFRERLRIRAPSVDTPTAALSGGNQQKVVLSKWLETKPRLLILDEPTRGIDVGSKVEVHQLIDELAAEGMAIILIS